MNDSDRTPEEWREPLMHAALPHIGFDGWTWSAFKRAADELGVDPELPSIAFGGSIRKAVDFYLGLVDDHMLQGMAAPEVKTMKIREKVTHAVILRFEFAQQHREAAVRLTGYFSHRPSLSARCVWRTADAVWRSLGDKSTDYNWYTKRAILSGVYSSTLMVWVGDDDENMAKTRRFLANRIENVMQFEKVKAQAIKLSGFLPSPARFAGRLRYTRR